MKIKHIPSGEIHELLTVDFEEDLMGVDGDCDICDHCEYAIETIQWFRCENCELLTNKNEMTPQFTTPCYVRIDDAQQRKEVCEQLELIGYIKFRAINRSDGTIVFTDSVFEDWTPMDEPTYAVWPDRLIRQIGDHHIDCGTNIPLFLDLAGMRSDTDKGQWFLRIDTREMAKCNTKHLSTSKLRQGFWRTATATEIIAYHTQKGETK